MPIQLGGDRTPLLLEFIRPLPSRRPSEIENRKPFIARKFQGGPVQEHVRAQRVILFYRRCPRNLQPVFEPGEKSRCHRLSLMVNRTYPCIHGKRFEDIPEKPFMVYGSPEIPHADGKNFIKVIQFLESSEPGDHPFLDRSFDLASQF